MERLICLLFLVIPVLSAQGASAGGEDSTGTVHTHSTGTVHTRASLRAALLYQGEAATPAYERRMGGRRSVPLAFGLSALVPGLGQVYNRQWLKALVGIGMEAALITGYSVWRRDGLAGERAFQAFANQQWDPQQYATWLNDYTVYLNTALNAGISANRIDIPSSINFHDPASWSAADRQIVDSFFAQIRSVERKVFHPETGAAFSHQLPNFGEQQYYELIGKYFQFAPGWQDYPAWVDADGNFTQAIDPEMTGANGDKPNVSPTFFQYAADHAEANNLLRRASRISLFFIVNHLIAGVDAAISAKLHNERVATSFGLSYNPDGPPSPVATMRLTF